MHPVLFKLGFLTIYSYGLLVALGFLAGLLVSLHFARKEGISPENILDLALYVLISGIAGARLFYVIGQWNYFKNNLLEIFMLQKGGLVVYGSLAAVLLITVWQAKKKKIPLLKLLDVLMPGMLLGYAIGRLGCFLNGCCFGLPVRQAGLPTQLPWGVIFPPESLAHYHFPGEALHPTQPYSSLSMFAAFIIILFLYKHKKFNGQIFFWGLILYSIYRFLIEFLRFSPLHWLGLTPSQWFAVFTLAIGVFGLGHRKYCSVLLKD